MIYSYAPYYLKNWAVASVLENSISLVYVNIKENRV